MEITSRIEDDTSVLHLAGRIDTVTSKDVEAAVNAAIASGTRRLVFDLRDVSYVSSAGLRAFLLAAKRATAAGGGAAVFGLQPNVDEVFAISGFGNFIRIAATEAEARERLAA